MNTRIGIIERLSVEYQTEINRRLDNSHAEKDIADWLNQFSEVRDLLDKHLEGRPIDPQIVSEWRRTGYVEWCGGRDLFHVFQYAAHGERIAAAGMTADLLVKTFLGRGASALALGDEHLRRLEVLYPALRVLLAVQTNEFASQRVAIARERLDRTHPTPA